MTENTNSSKNDIDVMPEKVPVFKSWKSWYLLVFSSLIFYIVLFYLFRIFFE